ncbi:sigma-70 family RNA polymerase sigma factor [Streptomyces sp. RKAG290]|uniref:sigma-70 family RNA polymerase sigma factor n=1 Tax=Streptomyces sp. RKAG290 TaxID=2888348 RepID=UPI00203453E0|nr:sigma-70 family RNA polymerase sigma factor [Streptomyces sp. RKAG290]MCM2412663.1 sigma-70 family RNA polymerase sigma factor [Streptomyces sp. RKAG290]
MAGGENTQRSGGKQDPGALTEEQAARMLAGMNDVIRAGEEMRKLRAEMIKLFIGFGWTQDRIARLTDMSQPAVSKQVTKYRSAEPETPMDLSLDQPDAPWLEGRLWGLAEDISETYADAARCTRCVSALTRGKKRFTPENVDELRRLVEEDLRQHGADLGDGHREAYDEISRGLDVPTGRAGPPAGSAAVRRTLAHRIQRDRLRLT